MMLRMLGLDSVLVIVYLLISTSEYTCTNTTSQRGRTSEYTTYGNLIGFLEKWSELRPSLDTARNFLESIPSTSKLVKISDEALGLASDIGSRAFEGGLLVQKLDPDFVNYLGETAYNTRLKVEEYFSQRKARGGRSYFASDSDYHRYKSDKDLYKTLSHRDTDDRYSNRDENDYRDTSSYFADNEPAKSQFSRGGYGYGGGGGGGYGGGGGGGYGGYGGYDSFSILGGLAFLTFLGVLLYAIATRTRRSIDIEDLDDPLLLSDLPDSVQNEVENGDYRIREPVSEDVASLFNRLWRDYKNDMPLAFFCSNDAERAAEIMDETVVNLGMILLSQTLGEYNIGRAADLLKERQFEKLSTLCNATRLAYGTSPKLI